MSDYATLFNQLKREKGFRCEFEPASSGKRTAIGKCTLYGHRISLYHASSGSITYRYIPAGGGDKDALRGRTPTREVADAFLFADSFLVEQAKLYLRDGILPRPPVGLLQAETTIEDAFSYIRSNFRKHYKQKQWREVLKVLHCAEAVWTVEVPYKGLDAEAISRYIAVRTEAGLVLPKEFSKRPTLKPCKPVTAVNDLRVLSALFRRLQQVTDKKSKERPFAVNPFSWLLLPEVEKALRAKPTARRFEVLLEFVDRVDPSGRLRLALVMAFEFGRRIGAIANLDVDDLRCTVDQMLETLRTIDKKGHQPQDGIQGEDFAYEFPEGGVYFDEEGDKENFRRLIPRSRRVRKEVELYLSRNPDLNPKGPLFPSSDDRRKRTTVVEFIGMLHAAEAMARAKGHQKDVPILYNSAFHGYRGLRASLMKAMGHRSGHIKFLVGWSCKVGSTMEARYLVHDPRALYAAVEGLRPVEIEQEYRQAVAGAEAENERLREENADLRVQIDRLERLSAQMEQILAHLSPR